MFIPMKGILELLGVEFPVNDDAVVAGLQAGLKMHLRICNSEALASG